MLINPINIPKYNYNILPKKPVSFGTLKSDSFECKTKKYPFDGKNSKKEYENMNIIEKTLFKPTDDIRVMALYGIAAAKILKRGYDQKYPQGYTIIAMGRSPFGAARGLEFMGEDVRYVPISGIRTKDSLDRADINSIQNYTAFLNSIGLNSKSIENSKKKFVVIDYTFTGNSLKNFKELLKRCIKTGTDKIDFRSLNKDLEEFARNDKERADMKIYKQYLCYSSMDRYSLVPALSINNLGKINNYLEKRNPESSEFDIAMLKEMDKRKLLV